MTLEEAKEEMPNITHFLDMACNCCTANDWYCPSLCNDLVKAKGMPFKKIQKVYAKHDGDIVKVCQYIRRTKI